MQTTDKLASTTPTAPRYHGFQPLRGLQNLLSSEGDTGRFGRMFRNLPVFEQNETDLIALAKKMIQKLEQPIDKELGVEDEDENTEIPAGYTYLGQFIDHDITFDPASSLQRQNDPDSLIDFRTPRFDLDSIYSRGPAHQPYLYRDGLRFLQGEKVSSREEYAGPDLPRNNLGRALIGDPRNDENLIISQLHALFLRFHNKMADRVEAEWIGTDRMGGRSGTGPSKDDLFKETQRRVRWHYQWIVINDFLPRIVGGILESGKGRKIVDSILKPETVATGIDGQNGPLTLRTLRPRLFFYDLDCPPFIPVEFSVAAYRFGHSMVRPSYFFNDRVRDEIARTRQANDPFRTPIFVDPRGLDPDDPTNIFKSLNGFRPLPPVWGFQWKYFYEVPERDKNLPQPSYKIDATLVNPLRLLPDKIADIEPPFSLAERNLLRGRALGLPSGKSVALAMGLEPLSPDELGITEPSLIKNTPLWYYVLKEAEVLCGSHHLGPVGARIVVETFIGLLWGDPLSYLRVEPTWTPDPDLVGPGGIFGMPELIMGSSAY